MIILTVIGVLAIIVGILYVAGALNSIHFMVGSVHHGHHQIRAIVCFVVGIACLIGAYIAKTRPTAGSPAAGSPNAGGSPSASAGESGSTSPSGS